jgi:hypothetical protein
VGIAALQQNPGPEGALPYSGVWKGWGSPLFA